MTLSAAAGEDEGVMKEGVMNWIKPLLLVGVALFGGLASATAGASEVSDVSDATGDALLLGKKPPSSDARECDMPCECGNPCPCDIKTCACDKTPPVLGVVDPLEIWPPDHRYHSFALSDCIGTVKDTCDPFIDVDLAGEITSIYSDEPEHSKGDGSTTNDIVIESDSTLRVRAERKGGGNGRVYGVTFKMTDKSGNAAKGTCYVVVPHDQSGDTAVDDGSDAGYTVY